MSRCVIIGGAEINDFSVVREYLKAGDYNIFCDSGLSHMEKLGIKADLIVGDFDSHEKPDTDVETIVLPCEKDDTDTVYAVKEALRRGFDEFLMLGVIGQRLDHTLGNLSILLMLDSLEKRGMIVDDYSEIEIVSREPVFIEDKYAYFSILSLDGSAKGVTVENAKYPLSDAVITYDFQYGISNEVLPGMTAKISVKDGRLLLIKIRK